MKLSRPLCFLDVESTGTDPAKDRVIDLGIVTVEADLDERWPSHQTWRFNPEISIPESATKVHGISDGDVRYCRPFRDSAKNIHSALSGCDLAGFSLSSFDIPILWEEFYRSGIEWDLTGVLILDAKNIFFKKEQRTLVAAVKFYCGEEHTDAHGALADAQATVKVLSAQLERYADLGCLDVDKLAEFCQMEEQPRIDLAGKLLRDADGDAVYGFGPKKGTKLKDDIGFARWMLGKDFSKNTKIAVHRELGKVRQTGEPL